MGVMPAASSQNALGVFSEIEETRLTGAAASFTFSGLGGRRFLHLSAYVLVTASAQIRITLNGDTGGTQYGGSDNRVNNTTWTTSFSNSRAFIDISSSGSAPRAIEAWIAKMSASIEAAVIYRHGLAAASTGTAYSTGGGRWKNTADAITSLEVKTSTSTMAADTVLHLEGRA